MKKSHFWNLIKIYFLLVNTGTHCDADDDKASKQTDIFDFNLKHPNFFTTPGEKVMTTKEDPEFLYRFAMAEAVELFESQKTQINYTKVHFVNVWGSEDADVKKITAKLNTVDMLITQKIDSLKGRLEKELDRRERSIMPTDWVTIDMLGRSWKEVERFIEKKIEERSLTKPEEDELYALREWLKFSDQELAIPYDAMKGHMEKVFGAERPLQYTYKTTPAVLRPFNVH